MCNHDNNEREAVVYEESFELKDKRGLIVRKPEVTDAEQLLNHIKVVDGETKFLAREVGELRLTVEQEESYITRISENTDRMSLIGTVDGHIIANCSVGIVNGYKRFRHRASLGIAIQKDYWRYGIGKIMMLECISWCKNNGLEQLELEVVTTNERAIGFYKDLGFEVYGSKKNSLKYDDGSYADEYLMMLDIFK